MPRLAIAGRPGHLPPTGVRKYLTSGSQNELVTTRPDSLPDYVETLKALLVAERVAVRQRRPSTLADWVGRGAWWLRPLHARLLDELRASPKLSADETAAPVLDPGRGRTKTGPALGVCARRSTVERLARRAATLRRSRLTTNRGPHGSNLGSP